MGLFEFIVVDWLLATSQYQPVLSKITNVSSGGSANQIAVFTSN